MKPCLIVHGPQGCGKTQHAPTIARLYGYANIEHEWDGQTPLDSSTLALTSLDPSAFDRAAMRDATVLPFSAIHDTIFERTLNRWEGEAVNDAEMTKTNVSNATGNVLNYMVAIALGYQPIISAERVRFKNADGDHVGSIFYSNYTGATNRFDPVNLWSQAGPMIDRFRPSFEEGHDGGIDVYIEEDGLVMSGDTYQVAALRAIVVHQMASIMIAVPSVLLVAAA